MKIKTSPFAIPPTLHHYLSVLRGIKQNKDYEALESSLIVPFDPEIRQSVERLVNQKKTNDLRSIVVVGIGGSNLGTKAVYDALYGHRDGLQADRYPKIIFLDTVDPEFLTAFTTFLSDETITEEQVLVNIISKSGGTTETLVNSELVLNIMRKKGKNWKKRCVITTERGSALWREAEENDIDVLAHPKMVGGRYSVFSAVGLFPLMLCGINVEELLSGAADMGDRCLSDNETNPSIHSSMALYHAMQQGHTIHNTFFFHPELESLGKWYRQLVGESLGKKNRGIFPAVSIGSNDLHSMVQLYLGGPKNIYTTFVYSNIDASIKTTNSPVFRLSEPFKNMRISSIMHAVTQGTIRSYQSQKLSYAECVMEAITPYELGQFMQWRMIETMLLAHLMGVNAFDQPEVELYKIETKKILAQK